MRGTIFAKTDTVVCKDNFYRYMRQCSQADGRPAVIGKDKKCAAERNYAAMQGHTVHHRYHSMLAHPVVDIAAGIITCTQYGSFFAFCIVAAGQVGRTSQKCGYNLLKGIDGIARRLAGGHPFLTCWKYGQRIGPVCGQFSGQCSPEKGRFIGMFFFIGIQLFRPRHLPLVTGFNCTPEVLKHIFVDMEGFVGIKTEFLFNKPDFIITQG